MLTSPPFIFPVIVIGGVPFVEVHIAPIDSNASNNDCIGRFFRLSSPVRVDF